MRLERFIVQKIAFSSRKTFSRFIIQIAVSAIGLSVAVMIITTSLVTGFQQVIKDKVFGFWAHMHVLPYSINQAPGEKAVYLNQNFYTHPETVPGLKHVQAVALKGGIINTRDNFEGVILKGVGKDYDWNRFQPFLQKGEFLSNDDDSSNVKDIIISSSTARRLDVDLGDPLIISFMDQRVRIKKFKIRAIYSTGIEEFDKDYALCNISLIQDLNHWTTDSVSEFELFVSDLNQLDKTTDAVYSSIQDPYLEARSIRDIRPNIFDWLQLQQMNEYVILIIMLIVAVINMITALLILILERTNMIGILKALGSNNMQLMRVFLLNAAVIISSGLLIGNSLGFGLCLLQKKFQFIRLPEDSYYVSIAPVVFNWPWIAAINVITFVICLLAMVLPCFLVFKINPVKAIRFS